MRKIITFLFSAALIATSLFFSRCSFEPVLPVTSSAYSVAEVDSIYSLHRNERKQHFTPPIDLVTIFEQDFPNAKDLEFEESSNLYEIEFEIRNDDYKAYYDKQNRLIFYKAEVSKSLLPAIVKNAILNKYPNYTIDSVDLHNKANTLFYKVEIKKGKFEYDVMVSEEGIILEEKRS